MTREEQLQLIRQKCVEANPEIKNRVHSAFGAIIRLADVLLAIEQTEHWRKGTFLRERKTTIHDVYERWNLRKDDLTQQSDECLQFLADLLK